MMCGIFTRIIGIQDCLHVMHYHFIIFVDGLMLVWAKHTVGILLFTNMLSRYVANLINCAFLLKLISCIWPSRSDLFAHQLRNTSHPWKKPKCCESKQREVNLKQNKNPYFTLEAEILLSFYIRPKSSLFRNVIVAK